MKTDALHQSIARIAAAVLADKTLRANSASCAASALRYFFFPQWKAAMFPGRIPVSQSASPIDEKIPFEPKWVKVYMDFVAFWIRICGFLIGGFSARVPPHLGREKAAAFILEIRNLYHAAARVYSKNFSTTDRPRYYRSFRFLLIHITDPHLMCVPSLHVMIAILSYTAFRDMLRDLGEEQNCAREIALVEGGALNISEAVLYVKQHSVNCVAAAMYAMSRCYPRLFPPEEAESFASKLFSSDTVRPYHEKYGAPPASVPPGEIPALRSHIIAQYRTFLAEGAAAGAQQADSDWTLPLLRFLEPRRIGSA